MPYLSEKIIIEKTKFDKRIKLTDDDKKLIIWLREEEKLSQRQLAARFNVSRRLITFVLDPEKKVRDLENREKRGGWKQYYDKEKNTEYMKDHRNYKQDLKVRGLISLPK
jgi:predicted HTH transcriptional regulator